MWHVLWAAMWTRNQHENSHWKFEIYTWRDSLYAGPRHLSDMSYLRTRIILLTATFVYIVYLQDA